MRTRAWRRWQRWSKMAHRISEHRAQNKDVSNLESWLERPVIRAAFADNPKMCSCWMCGNRRRHGKGDERLTMRERRADDWKE